MINFDGCDIFIFVKYYLRITVGSAKCNSQLESATLPKDYAFRAITSVDCILSALF